MTFQQLEYIVEISKCGSINKAAQKLFLSQSGISTAVRELESELGIALLARSNRGVEFTPEGELEFRTEAIEADAMYDEIGGALRIKELRREKEELFRSLELFYKVFFLGEDVEG